MANIKVKFRHSRTKGRPATLVYYVYHQGRAMHITTDIRLDLSRIDPTGHNSPVEILPDELRRKVSSDMRILRGIVNRLESSFDNFDVDTIKREFHNSRTVTSMNAFLNEQIYLFIDSHHFNTAANYKRALASFNSFCNGKEIGFEDFTVETVERYNSYLMSKKLSRNSVSFYMRILRAVYNKAIRLGYARQCNPFRYVFTGVDSTHKRAVDESFIKDVIQLDLEMSSGLNFAKDIFLFSFYTRGMAFVDIAYLRKTDIYNGMLTYKRHKTSRQMIVRIEPCIENIIMKYASVSPDSPYVFPILSGKDEAELHNSYLSGLRLYNRRLSELTKMMGKSEKLTSYTPRHSWANIAYKYNIPLSVISSGMGHSSERTTLIYIASIENAIIDDANKNLLEKLICSVS